jgi:hypothetical protein
MKYNWDTFILDLSGKCAFQFGELGSLVDKGFIEKQPHLRKTEFVCEGAYAEYVNYLIKKQDEKKDNLIKMYGYILTELPPTVRTRLYRCVGFKLIHEDRSCVKLLECLKENFEDLFEVIDELDSDPSSSNEQNKLHSFSQKGFTFGLKHNDANIKNAIECNNMEIKHNVNNQHISFAKKSDECPDLLFLDSHKTIHKTDGKRKRKVWTEREKECVLQGFELFRKSTCIWRDIKQHFFVELCERSNVDIKDCYTRLVAKGS